MKSTKESKQEPKGTDKNNTRLESSDSNNLLSNERIDSGRLSYTTFAHNKDSQTVNILQILATITIFSK